MFVDMVVAIRPPCPEVIVGDIPELAPIVGAAPAAGLAGRGTALFDPIAAASAAYGVKLIQIEFADNFGTMIVQLVPYALCLKPWMINEQFFDFRNRRSAR